MEYTNRIPIKDFGTIMTTPISARHALQLLLQDFAGNAEVTQKVSGYLQALPHAVPDAYLVEFDEQVGEGWQTKRHLVLDKPEGPYLDCATAMFRELDRAQSASLQELINAGQEVMSWVEAAHRPPVRDEFECGRMAGVRIHALADLREALLPFAEQPATPNVSGVLPVLTNKRVSDSDMALLDGVENLTDLTHAFERMGYVGMDKVRQSIAKMEGEPGYEPVESGSQAEKLEAGNV